MEWSAVINNPLFKDLPLKIELNKYGNIQYKVGRKIDKNKGSGEIIMECSIQTSDGVKVADVAWASDEFAAKQLCLEIIVLHWLMLSSGHMTNHFGFRSNAIRSKERIYFVAPAFCRRDPLTPAPSFL